MGPGSVLAEYFRSQALAYAASAALVTGLRIPEAHRPSATRQAWYDKAEGPVGGRADCKAGFAPDGTLMALPSIQPTTVISGGEDIPALPVAGCGGVEPCGGLPVKQLAAQLP